LIRNTLLLLIAAISLGAAPTASDFFSSGLSLIEEGRFDQAQEWFEYVVKNHPESAVAGEARYYLGVALFEQGRMDEARKQFADYLGRDRNPKHFEEVFEYKRRIADAFASGRWSMVKGKEWTPRWRSRKNDALELYDEVIVTLPSHPLAAEALANKGSLLGDMGEYVEAIETYQVLVSRFPKHPKMPEGYLAISELYLNLCRTAKHDPDLLALAHINLRKFRHDYPTDQRVDLARAHFESMRGVYAEGLYETGRFYERKKKPSSAAVYYRAAIRDYPDTLSADLSRERMAQLGLAIPAQ